MPISSNNYLDSFIHALPELLYRATQPSFGERHIALIRHEGTTLTFVDNINGQLKTFQKTIPAKWTLGGLTPEEGREFLFEVMDNDGKEQERQDFWRLAKRSHGELLALIYLEVRRTKLTDLKFPSPTTENGKPLPADS